jgi:hypothetical protein
MSRQDARIILGDGPPMLVIYYPRFAMTCTLVNRNGAVFSDFTMHLDDEIIKAIEDNLPAIKARLAEMKGAKK